MSPVGSSIRALELEGYLVLPRVLDHEACAAVRRALDERASAARRLGQWVAVHDHVQWSGVDALLRLLDLPAVLAVIEAALGDDVVCTNASAARYAPGYPGMPLHCDTQPYGSTVFGPLSTVPVAVRVFYYPDGLSAARAPLRVVPYSHLSLHADASPYRRHRAHADEQQITCEAGSAVIVHGRLFHGVAPNASDEPRSVVTVAYRPGWAGPVEAVPEPDPVALAALPERLRRLLEHPNRRRVDRDLPIASRAESERARGLGPGRWSCERSEVE